MQDHLIDPSDPPADLEPRERAVAGWFRHLERASAPPGLRARILSSAATQAAAATSSRARRGPLRLLPRLAQWPLGGWGVASAALLLLAIGTVAVVEWAAPVSSLSSSVAGHDAAAVSEFEPYNVRRDPALTLFHGLETFDEFGLPPGELLANWGR